MLGQFPYRMGRDWAASMSVEPLREFLTSDVRVRLLVLQCAVGLVLLIACANVAGLLLARATARQKEIALRVALGASRARIVRQLLTESLVLAAAGGALGIALAYSGDSVLQAALPPGQAVPDAGWSVLAFVCAFSLLTGLIFGVAPALIASRQDLAAAIKTGGQRTASAARARLRSALIVGEVALAVLLTIGAGLLIRSLWKLGQVNPGFDDRHVLALRVSPTSRSATSDPPASRFTTNWCGAHGGISRSPGRHRRQRPAARNVPGASVKVEGLPYVPAERAAPMFWAAQSRPGYFALMRIPILRGRPLREADSASATPVIVVSAATAQRYWPGQDPIGKHVQLVWEDRWRTVVGVAGDRESTLQTMYPTTSGARCTCRMRRRTRPAAARRNDPDPAHRR